MRYSLEGRYIVRLWDGSDFLWIDIKGNLSLEEAAILWAKETENGTKLTKYDDFDYYQIFPENTVMHYSTENLIASQNRDD